MNFMPLFEMYAPKLRNIWTTPQWYTDQYLANHSTIMIL
jgi:hypothetical protein